MAAPRFRFLQVTAAMATFAHRAYRAARFREDDHVCAVPFPTAVGARHPLCRGAASDRSPVRTARERRLPGAKRDRHEPPKWHLAHVTWFFETFLLKPFLRGYRPLDARYETLFNSYYNTVGPFHPRAQRHTLSRPTVGEVYKYRSHVDQHMVELIARCAPADRANVEERLTLGLNHEQQHQELLLMDIKRNFFANPMYPAYSDMPSFESRESPPLRWLEFPGGIREIGPPRNGLRVRQRATAP